MTRDNLIHRLILGSSTFDSDAQRKRILLAGYLTLLSFCIGLFYLFNAILHNPRYVTLLLHSVIVSVSITTLLMIRWERHHLAITTQLVMANGVVFYFARVDSIQMGSFLFFLSNALGAFALFGHASRLRALLFVSLSYTLFLITCFDAQSFLEFKSNFFLMINFSMVFLVCITVVYFHISLNHESEKVILEKNHALIKTNQELDRFVYNTSHDLRAPLSSMLGLINLAKKSKDVHEIHMYLDMMVGRTNKLDDSIKEIIDYSKNSRLDLVCQEIDLQRLIHEVIEDLQHVSGAEKINIMIEVEPELLLQSDRKRLLTVFGNLISNAIKYHDLNKAKPYIKIMALASGKICLIMIEDNGIGIAPEHHTKIFDMFYRASEKSSGSGLGLY
ncbi:MAG: sensor histidine kinase, partial [Bacteroidota bacterium]